MSEVTFVLGGCRSGKSSHALSLAGARARRKNVFVATCVAHDAEMADRVRRHQEERGELWQTVEAPLDLARAVSDHGASADVMVVDCLTLWMSNLIMDERSDDAVSDAVAGLTDALSAARCPVFLVSNEVGTGIVPENQLARRFRDLTGFTNQRMAACSDRVIWMVAGIPVAIK